MTTPTAVLLLIAALAVGAWWLCASPFRLALAGVVVLAAYPAPAIALISTAVVVLTVLAAAIVYRSLAESGGRLLLVALTVPGGVSS